MSENLFLQAPRELARLEGLLPMRFKRYSLSLNEDRVPPVNGKDAKMCYSATISFTRHDGTTGYLTVDGDSFVDLVSKIADKI